MEGSTKGPWPWVRTKPRRGKGIMKVFPQSEVTIPKPRRDQAQIKPGQELSVIVTDRIMHLVYRF